MTISSTTNRVSATGNGVTTSFSFPHSVLAAADLKVYQEGTLKTITTHYTLSGSAPYTSGTNVQFVTAPASGDEIVILRDPAVTQLTEVVENDPLPAKAAIETPLDKLTMIAQRLADLISRSLRLSDSDVSTASTVLPTPTASNIIGWNSGGTALINYVLQAGTSLVDLAASAGATLIGYTNATASAVATTVASWMSWRDASVFEWLTITQIAQVQAYTFPASLQTAIQAAMNESYAAKRNLCFPAGGYLVTGLVVPGTVDGVSVDDRDNGWRMYGQGYGEPFVHTNTGGTVIKSVTDAPVIQDILGTNPSSNGTIEIDNIRFDGTSDSYPVFKVQSFYGQSRIHDVMIYQRGNGDGFESLYAAGGHLHNVWTMNGDWAASALGNARTGIGFKIASSYDGGLPTITKCSARGWLTCYSIGGGAGAEYSPTIEQSECSVCYNGIHVTGTGKAVLDSNYFEGGEGGTGILDEGDYTTITNNLLFSGFAKAIDASSTSTKGTYISHNAIALGAVEDAIGIDLGSSAAFGGYNKNVVYNAFARTTGTDGQIGIRITGTDPRVNVDGNSFDPRGAWTGTGSYKISDQSTNGVFGVIQKEAGSYEIPMLSNGAVALHQGTSALTQADVSANILTIPDAGNYFSCNATGAATVLKLSAGVIPGRLVVFRTDSADMTFSDGAYMILAGGVSFTGPGMIGFMVDRVGADNYAYELFRSVF